MSDAAVIQGLRQQLESVIVGQTALLERLIVALVAGGHVLLEGPPGLAKTTAVHALASSVSASFQRIQFTPDLMPGDLTGSEIHALDGIVAGELLPWLEAVPLSVREPRFTLVHAGVHPVLGLAGTTREQLLEIRLWPPRPGIAGPRWHESYVPHVPLLIFGHDAPGGLVLRRRPDGRPFLVGLDTGCVYGNCLSAYLLEEDVPEILKGLDEQFVLPPLHAGWHVRRKSQHFAAYRRVVREFAQLLDLDPWLLDPEFAVCGEVNFQEKSAEMRGTDCLAANVDKLLFHIRAKYKEYGIASTPFVVVKADAGTYGMGIMMVKDASEVKELNRRQRNKMSVGKEGLQVEEVIIQEGVPTFETVDAGVAEPVVYMIDRFVVGGFYRVHTQRGIDENLNAPGMHFKPLAFETGCTLPDSAQAPDAPPNRFYAYGVVGRLALLAAARELELNTDA